MSAPLLVELGCEEFPPRSLDALCDAFAGGVHRGLADANLLTDPNAAAAAYAAPRRLALIIPGVLPAQEDREEQRLGPAVAAAFDDDGNPKPAALGFAKSCGVEVSDLERVTTDKGERLGITQRQAGAPLQALLPELLANACAGLPVPKPMRWGDNEYSFVRPVHWVVVLHGDSAVEGELLGQPFGRDSRGHRFHHPDPVTLANADDYVAAMLDAHVMVDRVARQERVAAAVRGCVEAPDTVDLDDKLLAEVTNLVEWPSAVAGGFDTAFLSVPAEALISSMQSHLRFFPVRDASGELAARFVGVANIESTDVEQVRRGYERVINPRLADARFFWEQDQKTPLEQHQETLANMVYQKQLGSQWDKVQRVSELAAALSQTLDRDVDEARAAAALAKCDLLSEMVGEFPDLQGTMGRYYAQAQGHPEAVAQAIEQHYLPRFSGDVLPPEGPGQTLAVAERLDTLCGIFAAGLKPTGNRDPFALRRTALGLIRILIEGRLDLSLPDWIDRALGQVGEAISNAGEARETVLAFVLDRLRGWYADQGVTGDRFDAVAAVAPASLLDFDQRIAALGDFGKLEVAGALAAANKRISNLLRKAGEDGEPGTVDRGAFSEAAEGELLDALEQVAEVAREASARRDYTEALTALAALRPQVDQYFDAVMVMADDPAVRRNRLATLAAVKTAFDQVADISHLRGDP
ncbi:MAG: glycine--tRNA ligase subunit beta [Pseudomonadota bacterium]